MTIEIVTLTQVIDFLSVNEYRRPQDVELESYLNDGWEILNLSISPRCEGDGEDIRIITLKRATPSQDVPNSDDLDEFDRLLVPYVRAIKQYHETDEAEGLNAAYSGLIAFLGRHRSQQAQARLKKQESDKAYEEAEAAFKKIDEMEAERKATYARWADLRSSIDSLAAK